MDQEEKSFFERLLNIFKKGEEPEDLEDVIEDIQELVDAGKKQGLVTEEERRMIERVLKLRNTTALDIMVPRTSMLCVSVDISPDELIQLIIEEGHSRMPVYEGNFDHIIGIIHAKDILKLCKKNSDKAGLKDILRPSYFIPETKRVEELLKEFKTRKSHMAVVIDEYGGTAGLITIEDILEEIVGEIQDEYDVPEKTVEEIGANTISVHAKTDIEQIEQHFGIEIPEGRYQSVGGFIINLTGRVPVTGETISFGSLRMEIESANERRIRRVRITKMENVTEEISRSLSD
ncbi:MAG: hemolysin family protein [Pseudomonadota bacterium]